MTKYILQKKNHSSLHEDIKNDVYFEIKTVDYLNKLRTNEKFIVNAGYTEPNKMVPAIDATLQEMNLNLSQIIKSVFTSI